MSITKEETVFAVYVEEMWQTLDREARMDERIGKEIKGKKKTGQDRIQRKMANVQEETQLPNDVPRIQMVG